MRNTINAIIIYHSHIVLNGLKSILLSKNTQITEIYNEFPAQTIVSQWKEQIIFIDLKYTEYIQAALPLLKKNKNSILGIESLEKSVGKAIHLDEIILLSDSSSSINKKIDTYLLNKDSEAVNNRLSEREMDVLKLVANGNSNKQIADKLFISIHTVISHRKNISIKLGIKTIAGLTMYASINNIIE